MVARFDPVKRQDLLLASFPRILEKIKQARLIFVGDGLRRKTLEQQALSMSYPDRIHFLGTRTDVPKILGASDLVVLISDHEGLPISLVEAMARGIPVLGTEVGGIPEIIDDGLNGFLIPAAPSPDFLAESVIKIWKGRDKFAVLGEAACEKIRTRFSVDAMADQLSLIYSTNGKRNL